jgi:hypothetical protein
MDNQKPTRTWIIEEHIQSEVEIPKEITNPEQATDYICDHDIPYLERSAVLDRTVFLKDPVQKPYHIDMLPKHMQAGVLGYLDHGWEVESFLYAILTNDLAGSLLHADVINTDAIEAWVDWLYNHCPAEAWGSHERVAAWQQKRRSATRV